MRAVLAGLALLALACGSPKKAAPPAADGGPDAGADAGVPPHCGDGGPCPAADPATAQACASSTCVAAADTTNANGTNVLGDFKLGVPYSSTVLLGDENGTPPQSFALRVYFPTAPDGTPATCARAIDGTAGEPVAVKVFATNWSGGANTQVMLVPSVPSGAGRILVAEAWTGQRDLNNDPTGAILGRSCMVHDLPTGGYVNDAAHNIDFSPQVDCAPTAPKGSACNP